MGRQRESSESVSLGTLKSDPHNARRHTPRGVGMIEQALREVGAARSIVVDETDTVLAGNATIEAAAAAGIERVRIIEADGNELIAVRRRGLSPLQKTRLALFDNRVGELSDWDGEVLADLDDVHALEGMFTESEVEALTDLPELEDVGEPRPKAAPQVGDTVSLPIRVADVATVERAIAATGQQNRGEALLTLCRAFLAEAGSEGNDDGDLALDEER